MAKQNVTFFERHLEKFVVGVCGLGLLALAWLYLINSPNVVVVGGETIGPKEYYAKFDQAAEQAAKKAKNEAPKQRPKPAVTQVTQNPRPYDALALPDRLVAVVPPSPPVPSVGDSLPTGDIRLAEILPPLRPVLTTSHGMAKLPERRIDAIGEAAPPPAPSIAGPEVQDFTWVAMLSAVDRKAQREAFQAAKYQELRLSLIVTEVQTERQQLLPSGQWGDPEPVTGFATWGVKGPDTLIRVKNEAAGYEEIPTEQLKLAEEFRQRFALYEKEQLILRPPFQEVVDEWWRWTLPKTLPGHSDVDLTEVGVRFRDTTKKVRPTPGPRTGPRTPANPRAGGPGAGPNRPGRPGDPKKTPAPTPPPAPKKEPEKTGEAAALKDAIEGIREAEKAFKEKDPIKGAKLLETVISNRLTPPTQVEKAQKLLAEKDGEIEEARAAAALKEQNKAKRAMYNYGPDIDPLWVTDITPAPGATYRYRIRLVAYNAYAGLERMVADPKDATKIVLTGQWSEWSDPIAVKPDRNLFFRKAADRQTAEFEIHQFSGGMWKQPATAKAAIGQPLTTGSGKSKIAYGAVVVDVNLRVPYKERVEAKSGPIAYRDGAETQSLTLVNARGEVEERVAADDVSNAREFGKEKAEEQKIREEVASTPEAPAPAPAAPAPANLPGPGGAAPGPN